MHAIGLSRCTFSLLVTCMARSILDRTVLSLIAPCVAFLLDPRGIRCADVESIDAEIAGLSKHILITVHAMSS
jgi:hypothetical protein